MSVGRTDSGGASHVPRPNIVFIMADDHAAHAIGAYGSDINETPGIDRLALEGMRFDACFCTNSGWFDKRLMYEESLRMPLLVRHPRGVEAGTTTGAMVLNVDFARTILDLVGVEPTRPMHGHALRPLRGELDGVALDVGDSIAGDSSRHREASA